MVISALGWSTYPSLNVPENSRPVLEEQNRKQTFGCQRYRSEVKYWSSICKTLSFIPRTEKKKSVTTPRLPLVPQTPFLLILLNFPKSILFDSLLIFLIVLGSLGPCLPSLYLALAWPLTLEHISKTQVLIREGRPQPCA